MSLAEKDRNLVQISLAREQHAHTDASFWADKDPLSFLRRCADLATRLASLLHADGQHHAELCTPSILRTFLSQYRLRYLASKC
ncbi:hypothetical protein GBAR_LOCUS30527 [Geodia barretti]|uniref:Uncharacterized protein n=1 Tax=Geodia barretti TaxID=519541 RepID=A0AA35TZT5_GEOBA|nr:hypothetical protein GBAR_LOCUS30527 [Geodia barretti]